MHLSRKLFKFVYCLIWPKFLNEMIKNFWYQETETRTGGLSELNGQALAQQY
jgi:hypothetical protein